MRHIAVLQPHLANQIAAGEVVERPASVVKELVENAIDAGASAVTVEIKNGGIDYIRVTDNGAGIPEEDCLLAFERHATSKISVQDDLTHIETLGFRGEALASIAAVAQTDLRTRPMAQESGMRVRIEGGEVKLNQHTGCSEGTTIEVENLFFNVPARRKFLKAARSEGAYVGEYLSRVILARPDISFRFINNGKSVYQSAGDGILKNAVYCVYGAEVLPHIKDVSFDDGYIRLSGYLGTAELARPNRSDQSFFLNGRYIRSNLLSHALLSAYDTRLMVGRFPFAVLNITISSREVDVNVHPAKLEVRFAQESRISAAVSSACRQALQQFDIPQVRFAAPPQEAIMRPTQASNSITPISINAVQTSGMLTKPFVGRMPDSVHIASEKPDKTADFNPVVMEEPAGSIQVKEAVYEIPHFRVAPAEKPIEQETAATPVTQEQFGQVPVSIVGQAFSSYWIVQQGENLFFIDQHAAHERKLYERFMKQSDSFASQTLLGGELLQLTHAEHEVLMRNEEALNSIGFSLEPFGATSVRVLGVPVVFSGSPVGTMLRGVLEALHTLGRAASTQELRRETIIQAACKHAVKAGDPLQNEEISELLQAFTKEGMPMTCPHGRPVMIQMSKRELEKLFKRIV